MHKLTEEGRNTVRAGPARRERSPEEAAEGLDDFAGRRAKGLDEVQKITDQHIKLIDDAQKKKDAGAARALDAVVRRR